MPSLDITLCASHECPRKLDCARSTLGRVIGPQQSVIDFRVTWGDNCGAYIPVSQQEPPHA